MLGFLSLVGGLGGTVGWVFCCGLLGYCEVKLFVLTGRFFFTYCDDGFYFYGSEIFKLGLDITFYAGLSFALCIVLTGDLA